MFADLKTLSADSFRGRFMLGPELQRAAQYIVDQYKEHEIGPFAAEYRLPFEVTSGFQVGEDQQLTLIQKGKATPVSRQAFTPLASSASGTVTGDVVFVGYACRSRPSATAATDGPAAPEYDDLAGTDARGKIALFFLETPGQPDLKALSKALKAEDHKFATKAAGLRLAGDNAGMARLHREARNRIASIVEPFLFGGTLGPEFYEIPPSPLQTDLELIHLLKPSIEQAARRPGPKFDPEACDLEAKLERLADIGAIGAIAVRGRSSFVTPEDRDEDGLDEPGETAPWTADPAPLPVVQLRWKEADRLFRVHDSKLSTVQQEIDRELKPRSVALPIQATISTEVRPTVAQVDNVLASISGTDLSHEVVILGAHYDHIGVAEKNKGLCVAFEPVEGDGPDTICNGADDNASGTAMVLELARTFADRPAPRRTLVFAHFAGEELGLLGANALAEHLPADGPFAERRVVAMVNLDMVGRLGSRGLAVGGISSSSAWMPLLDEIGTFDLKVLYERSIARRSDHASFYRQEIPVLFFFTHVHRDYHQPGDEVAKINRPAFAKIGQMVGLLMTRLADGVPVPFTPPRTPDEGLADHLPGQNPATIERRSTL